LVAAIVRHAVDAVGTEPDLPEDTHRLAIGFFRRADLCVGRVVHESNTSGSRALRTLREDQGTKSGIVQRVAILVESPHTDPDVAATLS
jgi:hypothetical protein